MSQKIVTKPSKIWGRDLEKNHPDPGSMSQKGSGYRIQFRIRCIGTKPFFFTSSENGEHFYFHD
jgi:hypothetical protein